MVSRFLLTVIGISFWISMGEARAEEATLRFMVLPGESLAHFLGRVPLCRTPGLTQSSKLSAFLAANPEKMDFHGDYSIDRPAIEVPVTLLESDPGCRGSEAPVAMKLVHAEKSSEARREEPAHAETREGAAEKKSESEGHHDEIHVGTFVESSQLHANGLSGSGEVVLNSKPEYGAEAFYYHALSENWSVGARYKFAKTGFNELDGVELKESFSSMQEASAGLAYRLSEGSRVYLSGGAAQLDHVTFADDDNAILVDAVWVPKAVASLELELWRVGRAAIGAGLQTAIYLPAGQLIAPGLSTEVGAFAEYELSEKFLLGLELSVGYQRQEFMNETHAIRAYGASLGLGCRP